VPILPSVVWGGWRGSDHREGRRLDYWRRQDLAELDWLLRNKKSRGVRIWKMIYKTACPVRNCPLCTCRQLFEIRGLLCLLALYLREDARHRASQKRKLL